MKRDHFDHKLFDLRITGDRISGKEKLLGFFLGPVSVILMNSVLNNYLNVYYTDVIHLGTVWGGWFLTSFPIIVKLIDAFTYVIMGKVIDRTRSRQGIARPWIFLSAPLLCLSMILLFAVPQSSEATVAIWIFFSYNLFYSVAYTAYNSAHTLNFGITHLGYAAPVDRAAIPVQNEAVQSFFVFCAVGLQTILFPVIAGVLMLSPNDRRKE